MKCSGKHKQGKYYGARTPKPVPTHECARCGLPGRQRIIGLDYEEITTPLCTTHALEAYSDYCYHVKNIMLENLTQQIKLMTR
jgi:hypothetical protein